MYLDSISPILAREKVMHEHDLEDYLQAKELAVKNLVTRSFFSLLQKSGFTSEKDNELLIPFLDRIYKVSYPEFNFIDIQDGQSEVPIKDQILILHYLQAEPPKFLDGQWISYREISRVFYHYNAFAQNAIYPLQQEFGNKSQELGRIVEKLKGKVVQAGDFGYEFNVFPMVPFRMILWEGDEEFDPSANILFDSSIVDILCPEDIAWMASIVVERLIYLKQE